MGVKFVGSLLYVLEMICITQGYVLVQVRKGNNQSDVNAILHKALPSEKFEEIAENARKQFTDFTKYTVKKDDKDNELENIVFALTNVEGAKKTEKTDPVIESIVNFMKKILVSNSMSMRTSLEEYNIKPEIVNFKNGRRSLLYRVGLKAIIKAAQNFIKTGLFKKYVADLIQKVPTLFNCLKGQKEDQKEDQEEEENKSKQTTDIPDDDC